jgi:hypothetical protein
VTLAVLPLALLAEAGVRALSVRRLGGLLGLRIIEEDDGAPCAAPALAESDWRLVRATERIFHHWPLGGTCLREAVVLGFLLRHRRPVLRIGVQRRDGSVHAHAWIEIDGRALPSSREAEGFVPLGRTFANGSRRTDRDGAEK